MSKNPINFNLSIKENITLGKEYDDALYKKVISICQLQEDIKNFKNQDNYVVNQGANNLSGGQK